MRQFLSNLQRMGLVSIVMLSAFLGVNNVFPMDEADDAESDASWHQGVVAGLEPFVCNEVEIHPSHLKPATQYWVNLSIAYYGQNELAAEVGDLLKTAIEQGLEKVRAVRAEQPKREGLVLLSLTARPCGKGKEALERVRSVCKAIVALQTPDTVANMMLESFVGLRLMLEGLPELPLALFPEYNDLRVIKIGLGDFSSPTAIASVTAMLCACSAAGDQAALTELDLAGNSIKDLSFLESLPSTVSILRLDGNELAGQEQWIRVALQRASGIKELSLNCCGLRDARALAEALAGATHLERLELDGNKFNFSAFKPATDTWLHDLPNLRFLSLRGCGEIKRRLLRDLPTGVEVLRN